MCFICYNSEYIFDRKYILPQILNFEYLNEKFCSVKKVLKKTEGWSTILSRGVLFQKMKLFPNVSFSRIQERLTTMLFWTRDFDNFAISLLPYKKRERQVTRVTIPYSDNIWLFFFEMFVKTVAITILLFVENTWHVNKVLRNKLFITVTGSF